ncbi:Glycerol kinase [Maioricimonas rarisocia]|uniref:Glycerol kinase n=1 Tax=Maioricimonas rarisocia TaxID=2528026 RepID=A0A517Z8Y6_9PLAN|nr:glycerol kinase GlpK [Maioricimonas rarisocia]QDU38948.1 Glycerol kinase [Maioricimonas rarisocia]
MPKYVLSLDQGTTSSRAIVFNTAGRTVAKAQQEFPQIYPRPGEVEHDPEAIWESQLATARQALKAGGLAPSEVAAIGIANQRETTLIWDRQTGRPVSNAIVWQSRISSPLCERLKADGLEPLVREKTGLVIDAYFSGTKIAWMLKHQNGLRERAERGDLLFGTVDSFLIWRLTGGRVHATDVSNACRTMLFNIRTLDWDDDLLEALKIPRSLMPEIRPNSGVIAETDPAVFGAKVPIAGVAGDQQAATFGQACFRPGDAKNTYGTGCFVLLNTGNEPVASDNGLLTTVGWQIGDEVTYCLEGSIFIAGAAVQWLRDGLGMIRESSEVETLAALAEDNGGVYFVPAFVGLGAPHWDSDARGTLIGLTRGTNRGHIARAALEAMAYRTRDVLDAMQRDANIELSRLKVDGGASVNDLLMQFQSDMLDVPVQRPVVQETTALGAAYLAGLAVGVWPDLSEIEKNWALDREFRPAMGADQRESLYAGWQRAVKRSLAWAREED